MKGPTAIAAENMGFCLDDEEIAEFDKERCDSVHLHVVRLANPVSKPLVVIGCKYTGRREFLWDSRLGVYSESLPLVGYDEWLVQQALCPPKEIRRRPVGATRQPA